MPPSPCLPRLLHRPKREIYLQQAPPLRIIGVDAATTDVEAAAIGAKTADSLPPLFPLSQPCLETDFSIV